MRHWILTKCPLARCSDEDGSYRHLYSQFWADRLSNCLFAFPRRVFQNWSVKTQSNHRVEMLVRNSTEQVQQRGH